MDATVKVWSLASAAEPRRFDVRPGAGLIFGWGDTSDVVLALDPGGGSVTEWDVVTGRQRGQTSIPRGRYGSISAGSLIAVAQEDGDDHRVVVCNARTGQTVHTLKTAFTGRPYFAPGATQLATAAWSGLEVIDLHRPEVRFRWEGSLFRAAAWSPDGRLLALAGRGEASDGGNLGNAGWVHVFDVGQRMRVAKVRHGTERVQATAVAWSPDGKRLVSGAGNGLVEVWEMPAGRKMRSARPHTVSVTALAWSPDGRRVASASQDGTVRLWAPDVGEELLRFDPPAGSVTQLCWSADGRRLAAATVGGAVLVWDATPGYAYPQSEQYAREEARARLAEAGRMMAKGRRDEALALIAQVLERLTTLLGPDHDETLSTAVILANELLKLGRRDEAIRLLEPTVGKLRTIHFAVAGVAMQAMPLLAVAYDEVGRLDDAERLWREVLARQLTDESEKTRADGTMARLGSILLRQKRYAEAEPILRECLAIREAAIPHHWIRFNAMSALGGALLGQGKYAEAESLLLGGYEGMKEREAAISANDKGRLPRTADLLAELYGATGRPEKAKEWRAKAAAARPPGK
jgi:tetratricopeptide (TPR) repeat protein